MPESDAAANVVRFRRVAAAGSPRYRGGMLQWLIVMAVGVVIWRVIVRPADCTIRFRKGRLRVRGRLAAGLQQRLEQYLRAEFPGQPALRIEICYPRASRPLRIRVRGRIAAGERQMIRNFLLMEL